MAKLPVSYKAGWATAKKIGGRGVGGAFVLSSATDILPAMREGRNKDAATNIAWTAQGVAGGNKAVGSYVSKKLGARAIPVAGNALLAWEAGQLAGEAINQYTPVQDWLARGIDKVTGLEARNNRALAPTKLKRKRK